MDPSPAMLLRCGHVIRRGGVEGQCILPAGSGHAGHVDRLGRTWTEADALGDAAGPLVGVDARLQAAHDALAAIDDVVWDPEPRPDAPSPDYRGAVLAVREILAKWATRDPDGGGPDPGPSGGPVPLPDPPGRYVRHPRGWLQDDWGPFTHEEDRRACSLTVQPDGSGGWAYSDDGHDVPVWLVCDRLHPHWRDDAVVVYTDGSCSKGGVGGWAWWTGDRPDEYDSGVDPETTNNRMELIAVIEAIRADGDHCPLRVVSDSTYVVETVNGRLWEDWRANGWVRPTTKWAPVTSLVPNRDLWEELLAELAAHRAPVDFFHVRGHGQTHADGRQVPAVLAAGNREADRLALAARTRFMRAYDGRGDKEKA